MQCTVDNCHKEAVYTFVWPWGTPGNCCQDHVVVVQQRSRATRGRFGLVAFNALNPDRPVAVTRDERIELHSTRLVAESERDDARKRAAELFAVNTKLSDELRALRARVAQFEADVKALNSQVELAIHERDKALIAASLAREEAERLGVSLSDYRTRDTPRDEHPPHVVE